tara:strand:- start:252 stop:605 length:354 start_codon:yes stop_codon:yes gene_type:complete
VGDIIENSGFNLTTISHTPYHRGFQVTFDNGYTVSVQFGPNSVCSVKTNDVDEMITPSNIDDKSKNAEVAVVTPNNELIPFRSSGEKVKSYVDPEELVGILTWVMRRGEENETANTP